MPRIPHCWAAAESTERFIERAAPPSLPSADKLSAGLEPCQPGRQTSLRGDTWPQNTSFIRSGQSIAAANTAKPQSWQVVTGSHCVLLTSTVSLLWHFLRFRQEPTAIQ